MKEIKVRYVPRTSVEIPYAKGTLETEQDVDNYIRVLRAAYIQQIKENKRIRL